MENSIDLTQKALDLLRQGAFPQEWSFIPVAGKETYVTGWTEESKLTEWVIQKYKENICYAGIGVVTGSFSDGLIAVDIDGSDADKRYKEYVGAAYEIPGEETTMVITSGREGRRQLLYKVPGWLTRRLKDLNKLIYRVDRNWHKGSGDPINKQQADKAKKEKEEDPNAYQEFVLRFNKCQSVLPGSLHPITGKRYTFGNYNDGKIADAPAWITDLLVVHAEPESIFSKEESLAIKKDLYYEEGRLPDKQIRGWFFKAEGELQGLLSKIDLVETFYSDIKDSFGPWNPKGDGKQEINYCPFHGGESGTSFQVVSNSGVWHCWGCGVGGDLLSYIHAVNQDDVLAGDPHGADLDAAVSQICQAVGLSYPECVAPPIKTQTEIVPKGIRMSPEQLLAEASAILNRTRNPAIQQLELMSLADRSGLYGCRASELKKLALNHEDFVSSDRDQLIRRKEWIDEISAEDFVIPGLVRKPAQYMVHSRGGVGKSEMLLGLAKKVGRGESIQIRGMEIQIPPQQVVWINKDQSDTRLLSMLEMQDIDLRGDDASWFNLVNEWKLDRPQDLADIINQVKPGMVVIDSLGTVLEGIAKENEGEYADLVYQIAQLNGNPGKAWGFTGTSIFWIHHNRKDGTDFRGSDRLLNAMDETWALRVLSEEEEADRGVNKRIMTVGKSRFGRGGDQLLISRDLSFNYELEDLTPLVQREGINRDGDSTPETLALRIIARAETPITEKALLEQLHTEMRGEGRVELPTRRAVRKYISIWIDAGLVEKKLLPSNGRGRPSYGFLARGCEKGADKIPWDSLDPWCGQGSEFCTGGGQNSPESGQKYESGQKSEEDEIGDQIGDQLNFVRAEPETPIFEPVDKIKYPETVDAAGLSESGDLFLSALSGIGEGEGSVVPETPPKGVTEVPENEEFDEDGYDFLWD